MLLLLSDAVDEDIEGSKIVKRKTVVKSIESLEQHVEESLGTEGFNENICIFTTYCLFSFFFFPVYQFLFVFFLVRMFVVDRL